MVGRIYKGGYQTLLHTQHKSSAPFGFREDFFKFSNCNSMGANAPGVVANLDPRGMIGRIHAFWFQRRRFFFMFFLF